MDEKWKQMWVAMVGTIKVDEKVDVTIDTKKYANLDARQNAIRYVRVDTNMGETRERKLDAKYG